MTNEFSILDEREKKQSTTILVILSIIVMIGMGAGDTLSLLVIFLGISITIRLINSIDLYASSVGAGVILTIIGVSISAKLGDLLGPLPRAVDYVCGILLGIVVAYLWIAKARMSVVDREMAAAQDVTIASESSVAEPAPAEIQDTGNTVKAVEAGVKTEQKTEQQIIVEQTAVKTDENVTKDTSQGSNVHQVSLAKVKNTNYDSLGKKNYDL